jgi:D-lactate dehydrogenase
MKAAFFEVEEWATPIIQDTTKKEGIEIVSVQPGMLDDNVVPSIKDAEIISVSFSSVTKEIIESLPRLKLIAVASNGYDHIDVNAARKKGVVVANDPDYSQQAVAEYAFSLMLSLARKLKRAFEETSRGIFRKDTLRGLDLAGKTLGVAGTGKIGANIVKIASAFGMKILCYDKRENSEIIHKYGASYVSFEELLANSDIITFHLPYNRETHHLVNSNNIARIKPGAIIINTSRGKIIETAALHQALKNEILGGAALDVFEGEDILINQEELLSTSNIPSVRDLTEAFESFRLQKYENVILTPHNAYNTHESMMRLLSTNLDIITSFNKTGDCRNKVS